MLFHFRRDSGDGIVPSVPPRASSRWCFSIFDVNHTALPMVPMMHEMVRLGKMIIRHAFFCVVAGMDDQQRKGKNKAPLNSG